MRVDQRSIQETIFRIGVGPQNRLFRILLAALGFVAFALLYNGRAYRNLNSIEAMDHAQLARNIAHGRGFTTQFVRPLSVHLITNAHPERLIPDATGVLDPAMLKSGHPDIANPPLYPLLLAAWMKLVPDYYAIPEAYPVEDRPEPSRLWTRDGRFWIYPPDFMITVLNQLLFGVVIVLTYVLGRRLFDELVATLSAVLVAGTELLWRFSTSGLNTMFLLVLFLVLIHLLVTFERVSREATEPSRKTLWLAVLVGAVVGLGALTRYSFMWLIIPVAVYLCALERHRRAVVGTLVILAFLVVMGPWVVRTWTISGLPFGTATYSIWAGTPAFPGYSLERSLAPDLTLVGLPELWRKLFTNLRAIVGSEVPALSGSWVGCFLLIALLIRFRSPAISRLRFFILGVFPVAIVVQALIRTQVSEDTPVINSENLLVLFVPLAVVYGTALFSMLLDQLVADTPWDTLLLRRLSTAAFVGVMCLPAALAVAPPRTVAIAYPPYYPPLIQRVANWMKQDELIMSDVPWAVAWYGDRQSIWLTHDTRGTFFFVHDYLKPVRGLFLTPKTLDGRFISDWIRPGDRSWAGFALLAVKDKQLPADFPLRKAPEGLWPEHLFLSDSQRW